MNSIIEEGEKRLRKRMRSRREGGVEVVKANVNHWAIIIFLKLG